MLGRSWLTIVGLCGITALLLGCAPGNAPGGPSGVTTPSASVPKSGGMLRLALDREVPHLDMQDTFADPTWRAAGPVYSKLLKCKAGAGVDPYDVVFEGDLAEKWEMPNDTTYVFYLRPGIKWQNLPPLNGRELTPDDIKYTIEKGKAPGAASRSLFAPVANVEAVDKQTVKITTSAPFAPFLANLTHTQASIIPKEVIDQFKDLKKTAIGTGPFILEEWKTGVGLRYKKNPDYFMKGLPYVEGIDMPILPDLSSAVAAFRTGQFHAWTQIVTPPRTDCEELERTVTGLNARRVQRTGPFNIILNVSRPPFNDVRVRRALSMALDRKAMIGMASDGLGTTEGPLPSAFLKALGLPIDDGTRLGPYFQYNLEAAKKLMAEAGLTQGLKIKALATKEMGPIHTDHLMAAMEMLKKVNVELDPDFQSYATFSQRKLDRKFDIGHAAWGISHVDMDLWVYGSYHSQGGYNFYDVKDPTLDDLLDKTRTTVNPEERKKVILKLQDYLKEQVYVINTFSDFFWKAWYPQLQNYSPSAVSSYDARVWDIVWLEK